MLLLFVLSISSSLLFAQQDSLLKNFKFRIDHFRAINYAVNAGSQFEQFDFISGSQKNSTSSGLAGASFFCLKSTDKILLNTSAGLFGSLSGGKSENKTDVSTFKNFSAAPRFSVLNKWFSKKMFTVLGTAISGNFYKTKDVTKALPFPSKDNQTEYSIALNMGIGKGRLENVTDMQNALWLYKSLVAVKSLSATLSADDLNGLGQSITKGNNTRVLDLRKRTQFLLSTVDSFLQQKGLITKTDIIYFSNLNDILFFAFNNPRLAGTEKFIRLTPAITGWNNEQANGNGINKYKHRFNTQSLILSSGFSKYIPANLIHQNNYGASLKLAYISTDLSERFFTNGAVSNEIKAKADIKQAGINLFYQHAVYPNTRTAINFSLQSEMGYQDAFTKKEFYGIASFSGTFNYFISYRTRLICNLGASYQKNYYDINQNAALLTDNIRLFANAGVEIAL